jgi:hypothetical protein
MSAMRHRFIEVSLETVFEFAPGEPPERVKPKTAR